MDEGKKLNVGIELAEKMIFKCELGEIKVEDCYIDETHKKEPEMWGPNPSRMLGVAILGCLSASFIFCLQKKDFTIEDLKANAEVTIGRNERGFWRVQKIDVDIKPRIDTPEMRKRADRCKKMFEDYCIVTQAVREGIEVNVHLDY
jgi:organic hydroperoxide reductase OsmC/OhrA